MTTRRSLLTTLPAIAFGIKAATAAPTRLLRVGFQKGEPILLATRQQGTLEKLLTPQGISVQWIEFQFGPPMLEAMRVGSIDIGAVGDTPPVFAQAAHGDLLYIAAQQSGGQAILLPQGSTLQTLQDLKGKKVAFGRGSSAHNLLLAALEKAGLTYADIQPVYLGPADAGAAFERGAIDAWSIWDPYYAMFESRPGVRVLAKWTDIIEQNGFIMASRSFVEANENLAATLVSTFATVAAWSRGHRPELAQALADSTGVPLDAIQRAVGRAPLTVVPMDDDIARIQQGVADRFRKAGLLPVDVNVNEQVWRAGA